MSRLATSKIQNHSIRLALSELSDCTKQQEEYNEKK